MFGPLSTGQSSYKSDNSGFTEFTLIGDVSKIKLNWLTFNKSWQMRGSYKEKQNTQDCQEI